MDSTAQLILWGGGLYFFRELVLEGIKLINRYLKIKEDEIQLEKNREISDSYLEGDDIEL
jgi:hypothetical protein